MQFISSRTHFSNLFNNETKIQHNSYKDEENKQKHQTPKYSNSVSHKRIFSFCLAFRILNSILVQSYFNPDEYWQGPEVAHRIALGMVT
ncbi:Alg9 mannosyltransferase family [Trifolium repens]|nr:Alg9 mannosyltransferase family [Trifolium repens]